MIKSVSDEITSVAMSSPVSDISRSFSLCIKKGGCEEKKISASPDTTKEMDKRVAKNKRCPAGFARVRKSGQKTGICRQNGSSGHTTKPKQRSTSSSGKNRFRLASNMSGPNGEVVIYKSGKSCPSGYRSYVKKDGSKSSRYCTQHNDNNLTSFGPAPMPAGFAGPPPAPAMPIAPPLGVSPGFANAGRVQIPTNGVQSLRKAWQGAGGNAGAINLPSNPRQRLRKASQRNNQKMPSLERVKKFDPLDFDAVSDSEEEEGYEDVDVVKPTVIGVGRTLQMAIDIVEEAENEEESARRAFVKAEKDAQQNARKAGRADKARVKLEKTSRNRQRLIEAEMAAAQAASAGSDLEHAAMMMAMNPQ